MPMSGGERHEFARVDAFTAATEGGAGQRTFYLQVRNGPTVVTMKCEKQQVAAIGDYFGRLLPELPSVAGLPNAGVLEPATPLLPEFVVGSINVAFDSAAVEFVVEISEVLVVDEEGEPEPGADEQQRSLQFRLDPGQATAFAARAMELVAAGRPTCRFCGGPIDPDGHACPRMN